MAVRQLCLIFDPIYPAFRKVSRVRPAGLRAFGPANIQRAEGVQLSLCHL